MNSKFKRPTIDDINNCIDFFTWWKDLGNEDKREILELSPFNQSGIITQSNPTKNPEYDEDVTAAKNLDPNPLLIRWLYLHYKEENEKI